MPKFGNLRDKQMSSTTLKDVRDTQQLKGEAKETKAERETNKTVQYEVAAPSASPKGGENRGV